MGGYGNNPRAYGMNAGQINDPQQQGGKPWHAEQEAWSGGISSASTAPPSPVKPSSIYQQFDRLKSELSDNSELILELDRRLTPVSYQMPFDEKPPQIAVSTCPMVAQLQDLAALVDRQRQALSYILQRLEI